MGEQHRAAKPKRLASEDVPVREPMRGSDPKIRRAPSADQKKTRRLQTKTATPSDPGDKISTDDDYSEYEQFSHDPAVHAWLDEQDNPICKDCAADRYAQKYERPDVAHEDWFALTRGMVKPEDRCADCKKPLLHSAEAVKKIADETWPVGSTERRFGDCEFCDGTGQTYFGKCPQCGGAGEKRTAKTASASEAHGRGIERGYSYGQTFTYTDSSHPWNTRGEGAQSARMDVMVQHLPHDLGDGEITPYLVGFSQGVDRAHDKQRGASPGSKTATQSQQRAENLQPGDLIRTPTGQSVRVKRVRNHETGKALYVDTDAGTSVVMRGTSFTLQPYNSTQQEIPGFGIPGANTNDLPFGATHGGDNSVADTSNASEDDACPNCGSRGTLHRRGGNYVCSKCGYTQQLGPLGKNPLLDTNQVIRNFSTVNNFVPAIARRARQVLANPEESP